MIHWCGLCLSNPRKYEWLQPLVIIQHATIVTATFGA
jgi:hypothetical protein